MITRGTSAPLFFTLDEEDKFGGAFLPTTEPTATATEWQGFLDGFLIGVSRHEPEDQVTGIYVCSFLEDLGILVTPVGQPSSLQNVFDSESHLPADTYAMINVTREDDGTLLGVLAATERAAAPSALPQPTRLGSQIDENGNIIPRSDMTNEILKRMTWIGNVMLMRLDVHENE